MSERLFQGFERGPDFDRARTRVATRFSSVVIDLSTTCPIDGAVYSVAGDFCYLDLQSAGALLVEFNSDAKGISPAISLEPGTGVDALFSSIRVFWSTNVGSAILIIATGDRIRPQSAATSILGQVDVNITGSSRPGYPGTGAVPVDLIAISNGQISVPLWNVANTSEVYGNNRGLLGIREHGTPGTATNFKSTTALAANTAETVLAPASNTAGLIVFEAGSFHGNRTAIGYAQLLAKTSAPTSIIDGDAHLTPGAAVVAAGPIGTMSMQMMRPHRSQTGKGLYFIIDRADVDVPYRICKYLLF